MSAGLFAFEVQSTDSQSGARVSTFVTPHGEVQMPAFIPVGTQGTVKGLSVEATRATGAQMVLGQNGVQKNAEHQAYRNVPEVSRQTEQRNCPLLGF